MRQIVQEYAIFISTERKTDAESITPLHPIAEQILSQFSSKREEKKIVDFLKHRSVEYR